MRTAFKAISISSSTVGVTGIYVFGQQQPTIWREISQKKAKFQFNEVMVTFKAQRSIL